MSFNILSKEETIHTSRMLEASAGTGKTFTIEHLVVRLLIEEDPKLGRPLSLDEILIVTFTKKAVRDLKERVHALIKRIMDGTETPEYLTDATPLRKAFALFDECKIFTIHGFAARALLENAFETGYIASDEDTLSKDELHTLGCDFFETEFCLPDFSQGQLASLLSYFAQDTKAMVNKLVDLSTTFHTIERKRSFEELYQAIAPLNLELSPELIDSFKKSRKEIPFHAFKNTLSKEDFDTLLEQGMAIISFFSEENRKVKKTMPIPEDLREALLLIEEGARPEVILVNAAFKLKKLILRLQEETGRLSYDAILLKARDSKLDVSGYQALIIDEFQDTDPVQWEMFEKLFLNKAHICLVGDPKQSIYRFRQADIYTYLKASESLGDTPASLRVNYRSNQELVDGINRFFKNTAMPLPKIGIGLPYYPVEAGRKDSKAPQDGKKSFHIVQNGTVSYIVNEIQRLHEFQYNQFAVLVKDRFQGKEVEEALTAAKIPVNNQRCTTLIGGLAHKSLIDLLEGVIHLKNQSKLKMALAGPIIAFDAENFPRMDDISFLGIAEELSMLRSTLFSEGFGLFFEKLLSSKLGREQALGANLLQKAKGDELYSDLRTIAERLMEQTLAPDNLLTYLKEALQFEPADHEEWNRKRGSSHNAVTIVTIHSSKGLEWDIVFAIGLKEASPAPERIIFEAQVIKALLKNDEALYEKWCAEIDAEKMRQLYVGVTRARERLYLFMPEKKEKIKPGTASPLDLWHLEDLSPTVSYETFNDEEVLIPRSVPKHAITPPKPLIIPDEKIQIASFTTLATKGSTPKLEAPSDFDNPIKTPFTLPAGKETGIFIHSLFEKLDQKIEPLVHGTPFEPWLGVIQEMVESTLNADLGGFTLNDVEARFHEKEFLFPSDSGFLKGVIDLAFTHKGKYYIVDWKTNWLGNTLEDYNQAALQKSMEENEYLLQAKIYKEALKNYMSLFSDDTYGGAFYIYVRGVSKNTGIYHEI